MKRKALLVCLVLVFLALGAPTSTYGAGNDSTVGGTVTGPAGPIASASVRVEYLTKGGLPRTTTVLTTAADGTWSYTGKAGTHRFTFSADGHFDRIELLTTVAKATYTLDVQLPAVPPPMGTIEGRIIGSMGSGLFGYVYFYKQNADGTWPEGYIAQVNTNVDGTYTSGLLPLGTYKVRLFTMHTGVQWYQYVLSMDLATPLVLDTAGQVITGINAQFPPPTP